MSPESFNKLQASILLSACLERAQILLNQVHKHGDVQKENLVLLWTRLCLGVTTGLSLPLGSHPSSRVFVFSKPRTFFFQPSDMSCGMRVWKMCESPLHRCRIGSGQIEHKCDLFPIRKCIQRTGSRNDLSTRGPHFLIFQANILVPCVQEHRFLIRSSIHWTCHSSEISLSVVARRPCIQCR